MTWLEQESLQRITQLKEKPALALSAEELQQLGLELFCMSPKEYAAAMEKREIKLDNPNNPVELFIDATLPFHIANKLYGTNISVSTIATQLRGRENNFGLISDEYKYKLQRIIDKSYMLRIDSIESLFGEHLQLYQSFTAQAQKQAVMQQSLSAKATINAPQKVATIQLDYYPLQLVFTHDNQLVLLGTERDPIELLDVVDFVPKILQTIDPQTGNIIAIAKTDDTLGMSLFSYHGFFTGFQYKDTLTIGLDDIIYIDGGRNRFTKSLEQITSPRDPFSRALTKLAKSHHFEDDSYTMIAVHETKESFLYLTNRTYLGKNNATVFLVSKKSDEIHSLKFSPNSSFYVAYCEEKPRVIVNDASLFFREQGQLLACNIDSFRNARESTESVIPYNRGDFMPSYHCLDASGRIWALTMENGEVHPSIKAFEKRDNSWQFAAYFYPEDAGLSLRRSLAVSNSGILAYSNATAKTIDLYKL